MPCNPNINLSRRTWEGGGGDSNSISNNSNSNSSVQRKAEIGNRASPSLFSEQQEDPPPKHSIHTTTTNATKFPRSKTSTRTERLLLERQQRKNSNSSNTSTNSINNNSALEDDGDNGANGHMERGDRSPKRDEEEGYSDRPPGATNSRVRQDGRPSKQRLLVVANRLPVSATRKGEDSWSLEISAGGLVSALLGLKQFEAKWIGWAGVNVPDKPGQAALTKALAEKRCIPVFLDEEIVHQYYNGYCNNVLWPLFHYLGLPQEDRLATTRSFQSQFDAYKKANEMFAEVVHSHYKEGDVVWCHDYHLMFLPKCLKDRDSNMKVGWFLHTPFPSSEIHRTLPSRSELLRAVLAADLVGFHTYDYARHFVSACTRILGLEGTPEGVEDQGKLTRVAAIVLQERPRVVSSAVGHAWDLPENTFGAAYAKFMGSRNFSPDDRPPVRFMDTEELAYVATRAREIHDFWHVLFNLPTNLLGESALKVVEFQQLYLPMCLLSTIGGSVRMKTKQREHFFKYYFPWAVRAGMSCTDIMSIYYEKHFDEDLELVRNRWGILPASDFKNLRPLSNS